MSLSEFLENDKERKEAEKKAQADTKEKRKVEDEQFSKEFDDKLNAVIIPTVEALLKTLRGNGHTANRGQNKQITYVGSPTVSFVILFSGVNLQVDIVKQTILRTVDFHYYYTPKAAHTGMTLLVPKVPADEKVSIALAELTASKIEDFVTEALAKIR